MEEGSNGGGGYLIVYLPSSSAHDGEREREREPRSQEVGCLPHSLV